MHGWVGRVSQIFFYKEKEKKLAERWGGKAESDMVPAIKEKREKGMK